MTTTDMVEAAVTGRVCALIPAAGRGVRFGGTDNKIFAPILNRPLMSWTLEAFAKCEAIDAIVLVAAADEIPRLRQLGERFGGGKLHDVVVGGEDRQTSVRLGLVACADFEWVAVHDAARPCITPEQIAEAVAAVKAYPAVTLACPVADTLVRQDTAWDGLFTGETVPRDGVYAIQTPQIFETRLLREAHQKALADQFTGTDDAGLVQRMSFPVQILESGPHNLKVTRPADVALAEALLEATGNRRQATGGQPVAVSRQHNPTPNTQYPIPNTPAALRIGHGYDVHPFAEGRKLYLGGVEFVGAERGLLGHSDADVVLHATCDALLGAAGLGDIGKLFPPSDMRHKDRRSTEFLGEVRALIEAFGWAVGNVDITILAEFPKIGPKSDTMKEAIAECLGILPEQVGIKATTNEGLGFVGRGEGIAVHATALLIRQNT